MLRRIRAFGTCIALLFLLGACSRAGSPHAIASSRSRGATIFAQRCSACHGAEGRGGPIGPMLRGRHLSEHGVRFEIEHPQPPMPKLFPGELSPRDLADVTAYVVKL